MEMHKGVSNAGWDGVNGEQISWIADIFGKRLVEVLKDKQMEADEQTGEIRVSLEARMAMCTSEKLQLCNLLRYGFQDWVRRTVEYRIFPEDEREKYNLENAMDLNPEWFAQLFYESGRHAQDTLRLYLGAKTEVRRQEILQNWWVQSGEPTISPEHVYSYVIAKSIMRTLSQAEPISLLAITRRAEPVGWQAEDQSKIQDEDSYSQQQFQIEFVRILLQLLKRPMILLMRGQINMMNSLIARKKLETLWWHVHDRSNLVQLAQRGGGEAAVDAFLKANPALQQVQEAEKLPDAGPAGPAWRRRSSCRRVLES